MHRVEHLSKYKGKRQLPLERQLAHFVFYDNWFHLCFVHRGAKAILRGKVSFLVGCVA